MNGIKIKVVEELIETNENISNLYEKILKMVDGNKMGAYEILIKELEL